MSEKKMFTKSHICGKLNTHGHLMSTEIEEIDIIGITDSLVVLMHVSPEITDQILCKMRTVPVVVAKHSRNW